ncbi:AbrB/MazE/SpoVT family DNA-binding domain-containing protein [Salinarimonas sp.]|uniref:AbrB/MazE/SpoVT family DNA-binding domain-containing protein n=1 Tax=Salinarimonas sp. TaxID=2766526 RepID=UPI0032D971D0
MGSHATIGEDGSVAVPDDVRRALGLKAGDRVEFTVSDRGRVEIRRVKQPFDRLAGLLSDYARPVSDEDRARLIGEAIGRKGRE